MRDPPSLEFMLEMAKRQDLMTCRCQFLDWSMEYFPTVRLDKRDACCYLYFSSYGTMIKSRWEMAMEEVVIGFFRTRLEAWRIARNLAEKMKYLSSSERSLLVSQMANIDKWIENKIACKRHLEYRYRCVNGHNACHGGAYAGPDCPYCMKYLVKLTLKDILFRKEKY